MPTVALRLPAFSLPRWDRRHWPASLVLTAVFGLNIVAGFSIVGMDPSGGSAAAKVTTPVPAALRGQTPPAPEPLRFRDIAPTEAVEINAAVPIADLPNPAARPFAFAPSSVADKDRALHCLTQAIYYEAATEPLDGQRAVAQVVLNRLRHPAYPNTVCGVVFQGSERSTGCQFTFTCDGALARAPIASIWNRTRQVAEAALAGYVYKPVGWATHYHTNWVVPYWSSSLVKLANVGTHIFYRWTGGWGTGPAFRDRHAGVEPDVTGARPAMQDAKALAAAEAALLDVAAAEQAQDGEPVAPTSVDSFQRAVLRRYEPAKAEGIASVIAKQTRSGDAVTQSYRWALMGDSSASKDVPFGKKPEQKKGEAAAPAQPKELEGVRKVGEGAAPAATK